LGRGIRYLCGGILGLLTEAYRYENAVRSDLLGMGRSLDDVWSGRLSWQDLKAYLVSPPMGSCLAVARGSWSPNEHMQSLIVHLLRVLSWQTAGDKRVDPPEYMPVTNLIRPPENDTDSATPYGEGTSIDEMRRILNLPEDIDG